jgi:1,4-alpha-glucan branching enzyme
MPAVTRSMKQKKITKFSCQAERANSVRLAGTFNDWNAQSTPMSKSGPGEWSVDLELAPGVYEYRFVVDGQWFNEPECANHESCPHCVPNPFGSKNQKLQVE